MKEITSCPVCHSTGLGLKLNIKDYSITQENFNLLECPKCKLHITSPQPNEENIGKYYNSEKYVSHTDSKKGIINAIYHRIRKITLTAKLELINTYSKPGNLLDIGCGTGYFLKKCQENGWRITGTEPDNGARQKAKDLTAKEIYGNIDEIKAIKEFNVITLWHVLEHIHDPVKALVKIKELLKDEGTLIIAVPNLESNDSKYYQETWAAYDVPRHLYHFSKTALNNLLTQTGFQLIETKPMKFDSYYVSMLSEKYKGTNNLLNAFITGYKSNLRAKKESGNYSSIIYIARIKK